MPEEKELEESEQYREIEEISKIVNKEITKTLVWIALVIRDDDRSKSSLCDALGKAIDILDHLYRLQDILKVELSLLTK